MDFLDQRVGDRWSEEVWVSRRFVRKSSRGHPRGHSEVQTSMFTSVQSAETEC